MLNFGLFQARTPEHRPVEECAFRKRASEQWQESVTAYHETVKILAQHGDYEAVHKGAETLCLISQEIKQILEDHEREHGCGYSEVRGGERNVHSSPNDNQAWYQSLFSSSERNCMRTLGLRLSRWVIWAQASGQDLIEYALMAGFVAVAAGAVMPGVATSISKIFSKVSSVLSSANAS
jgi:Flp pilus assembly pilin Flp